MSICHCISEEQARLCHRAGTRMVKPLWEVCQRSEAYRRLWDSLPQVQAAPVDFPTDRLGIDRLKSCQHRLNGAVKVNGKAKMRES